MLFDIYTKEFELDGQTYKVRPLCGRYIGKLYDCIGKMGVKEGMTDEDAGASLNGEAMADFYEIALETFKQSYPDQKEEVLAPFVSQNLMRLLQPISEVNINAPDEKKEE